MKASSIGATLFALLASTASAKVVNSKPFHLVLESENTKLDGAGLSACHEGAAIESICKHINTPPSEFRFRKQSDNAKTGQLTFLEDKATHDVQVMSFYKTDKKSNAVASFFGLGKEQKVEFDDHNRMSIDSSKVYHSYMCEQTFEAYTYNVLSWVSGSQDPDNNTCKKVNVKRVFT